MVDGIQERLYFIFLQSLKVGHLSKWHLKLRFIPHRQCVSTRENIVFLFFTGKLFLLIVKSILNTEYTL